MKNSIRSHALCIASIALAAIAAISGIGQQPDQRNRNVSAACLRDLGTANETRYRAVRIIDDRATGHSWLLVKQLDRPGTPAVLLQIADDQSCSKIFPAESEGRFPIAHQFLPRLVIRPGDSVILSEDSLVADARLEAIAIEPAVAGQSLTVRLKLGGHLLRAVAIAPGSALMVQGREVRR